jgi:hypothetical protein
MNLSPCKNVVGHDLTEPIRFLGEWTGDTAARVTAMRERMSAGVRPVHTGPSGPGPPAPWGAALPLRVLCTRRPMVPGVHDFLDRFRPAGAPGTASGAGVPIDRRANAAAELAPVFAALADTERECAGLRDEAARDAARWADEAARQASALVARATVSAAAERAEAAARGRRRVRVETAGIVASAAEDAEAVRRDFELLLPDLVVRVVGRVRADLVTLVGDRSAEVRR